MIPKKNEIYRHFKGNLYKIITTAIHTETDEELVVYQALYGNYMVYCRPLSMFISKVDIEKYPDAKQEYRFEKIEAIIDSPVEYPLEALEEFAELEKQNEEEQNLSLTDIHLCDEENINMVQQTQEEQAVSEDFDEDGEFTVDPDVMAFLDAETVKERKNILTMLHNRITDDMIYTLAIALDIVIDDGDLEDRYRQLMKCLDTIEKYEIDR